MSETLSAGPDMQPNHLKSEMLEAVRAAGQSIDRLGADGRNPLERQADILADAWKAGTSSTRTNFIEDVRGVGDEIRRSFDGAREDLRLDANAEPLEIDVTAHPDQEWKTKPDQIRSRSDMQFW